MTIGNGFVGACFAQHCVAPFAVGLGGTRTGQTLTMPLSVALVLFGPALSPSGVVAGHGFLESYPTPQVLLKAFLRLSPAADQGFLAP